MANLNKVMIIGNLTRDPEIRYTPKGTAVGEFSMAVNRKFEDKEETTFIDVTLWGKTAELVGQYLRKGSSCYVEGRLHLDTWEDKQSGQKRSKLKVVGETVQFLDGKPKQAGNTRPVPPGPSPMPNMPAVTEEDEDLPF
jgi:single-strand DNA-binding protein